LPEDELRDVIRELRNEVQVLRQVLDELRDEVQWANRNGEPADSRLPRPFVLTSMPLDPAAKNWEINRLKPSDLPENLNPQDPAQQSRLF
jgi:hypothetical protein